MFYREASEILILLIISLVELSFVHSSPTPQKYHIAKLPSSINDMDMHKRNNLHVNLVYEDDSYYATTIEIGNPKQEVTVLFDTGSADLWVMDTNNPFCIKENNKSYNNATYNKHLVVPSIDCQSIKTYECLTSSSFEELDIGRFYITYADGSFADGKWAMEDVSINGITISNMQFGLATYATTPVSGVLGIGFQRNEAVKGYDDAPGTFYPNFPQVLKEESITDIVAYSLSLGEASSILFGAFDTSEIQGDLFTFPMVNVYPTIVGKPATLAMSIQGLGAQNVDTCQQETFFTTKYPVLIDSGSTLIKFPLEIADAMAAFVNATYSHKEGIYILDCPTVDNPTEFLFDFGDLKVNIPLSNFILPSDGNGYCGFGVLRSSNTITLGDSFLTSVYAIFDLDNYQISLAQKNLKKNEENIVNIPSDGNIPNGISASVEPWSTHEPFTITSNVFSKSLECANDKESKTMTTTTLQPSITSSSKSSIITSFSKQTSSVSRILNQVKDVVILETTLTVTYCPTSTSSIN